MNHVGPESKITNLPACVVVAVFVAVDARLVVFLIVVVEVDVNTEVMTVMAVAPKVVWVV